MLFFVSRNVSKWLEYEKLMREFGVAEAHIFEFSVTEIQSIDDEAIARAKAIDAYKRLGRPLFVEHTSLRIEHLNGFPGGFTRPFIETIGEQRVCELFGGDAVNLAIASTTIAYCDTMRVSCFEGRMSGRIASRPAGGEEEWERFGWNRVFIPDGFDRTLSQLGAEAKNRISMRRAAMEKLANHLRKGGL